jgi:hypothetical protein
VNDLKDKFSIKDTSNSNFFETWEWHFKQNGNNHAFESGLNDMRQMQMKRLMEEQMNDLNELKTVQLIINFVVVMAILAVAVTVGRYLG